MVEQLLVGGRVGAVDAAGEHRDVGAVDGQRAAVGGLVDAEGGARDHRVSGPHQRAGDAGGDLGAVGRRRAGPDDRHRPAELVEPRRALSPRGRAADHRGRRRARRRIEVVDLARATRVARDDVADAQPRSALEVAGRIDAPQPGGDLAGDLGRWSGPLVASSPRSRTAPSCGDQAGDLGSTRLGRAGVSATRASRGRRSLTTPAGARRPARPAAAPWRSRSAVSTSARVGRVGSAQVGDRPGQPVDPDRAAPAQPAGEHLRRRAGARRRRAAATRARSGALGTWELSRHARPA